jgi:dihydrofolate reductase
MRINLIYARAANGVIGLHNRLPWHLPEDLAHFKRHTLGCPVLMGRATWDGLPPRFRPLPGRLNLVLTRDALRAAALRAEGAQPCTSLEDALAHCAALEPAPPELWVIGGAQIYAQALPLAQRVLATEIDADFEGDAHAPPLGPQWRECAREPHTSTSGLRFAFVTYCNSNASAAAGQSASVQSQICT